MKIRTTPEKATLTIRDGQRRTERYPNDGYAEYDGKARAFWNEIEITAEAQDHRPKSTTVEYHDFHWLTALAWCWTIYLCPVGIVFGWRPPYSVNFHLEYDEKAAAERKRSEAIAEKKRLKELEEAQRKRAERLKNWFKAVPAPWNAVADRILVSHSQYLSSAARSVNFVLADDPDDSLGPFYPHLKEAIQSKPTGQFWVRGTLDVEFNLFRLNARQVAHDLFRDFIGEFLKTIGPDFPTEACWAIQVPMRDFTKTPPFIKHAEVSFCMKPNDMRDYANGAITDMAFLARTRTKIDASAVDLTQP